MKDGLNSKVAARIGLAVKKIFFYRGPGTFGESFQLSIGENGELWLTVCSADEVNEGYCEPGPAATMVLPCAAALELVCVLMDQYLPGATNSKYPVEADIP